MREMSFWVRLNWRMGEQIFGFCFCRLRCSFFFRGTGSDWYAGGIAMVACEVGGGTKITGTSSPFPFLLIFPKVYFEISTHRRVALGKRNHS